MTEKTAQEIIELLTLNGRKPEHIKKGERVVYLSDAISIVRKALMPDHQQAFAVGEYVAVEMGEDLSGLMRIEELKDTQDSEGDKVAGCWGRVFNTALKDFDGYSSFELSMTKPATAEQMATIKRAEQEVE